MAVVSSGCSHNREVCSHFDDTVQMEIFIGHSPIVTLSVAPV